MNERRRNFNWLMSWPEKEFYGRAECADRQETTLIFIECILVIGLLWLDTWKKGERKQQNQRNILQSWEEQKTGGVQVHGSLAEIMISEKSFYKI